MKFILLLPLLILSGCYQMVNKYDLDNASLRCEPHEGIAEISASFLGDETVTCHNGKQFLLHSSL